MDQTHSQLCQQLRTFVDRAIELSEYWIQWLRDYEWLIVSGQTRQLEPFSQTVEDLFSSIRQLQSNRDALLANARSVGISANDARGLYRALAKQRPDELPSAKLKSMELNMAHLKRMLRAAWVLISHCARHTEETLMLMTLGRSEESVYIASPMADDRGGLLLDQTV